MPNLPETVRDYFTPEELGVRLDQLRRWYQQGALGAAEFNATLSVFQFNDDVGHLWAPGANSGQWYRWDRTQWTQAQPPAALMLANAALESSAAWLTTSGASTSASAATEAQATTPTDASAGDLPLRCAQCNRRYASGAFCMACGGKLEAILKPTIETCSGCNAPLEPGSRFCKMCGRPLVRSAAGSSPPIEAGPPVSQSAGVCPKCGSSNVGKKFCTVCGAKLQ